MNILFLNSSDIGGGPVTTINGLKRYFTSRGLKTKLMVGYKSTFDKDVYELNKNKLFRFIDSKTHKDITNLLRDQWSRCLRSDLELGADDEFFNHEWYKNADVVHLHNLYGNFLRFDALKRISQEKVLVWTLHDMWSFTNGCSHAPEGAPLTRGLIKCEQSFFPDSIFKKADFYKNYKFTCVTPSHWLLNLARKTLISNNRIVYIHHGVDIDTFKPRKKDSVRRELRLPKKKKIVIFVALGGTKNPHKGGEYFKEIVRRFENQRNIIFLLIGSNEYLGKNVLTLPFIADRLLLAKYFSASDILILPSTQESSSYVAMEAIVSGLPVVGFDVGGASEIMESGNSYIAKYKETNDLEKGIRTIIEEQNSLDSKLFKKNIEKLRMKYSEAEMGRKYLALYESLL